MLFLRMPRKRYFKQLIEKFNGLGSSDASLIFSASGDILKSSMMHIFLICIIYYCFIGTYESVSTRFILEGAMPLHYAWLSLLPENFIHDFPKNLQTYNLSIPMWIYSASADYAANSAFFILKVILVAQISIIVFGIWHLSRSLECNDLAIFSLVIIFLCSSLPGLNLSRFSDGIQGQIGPLYYGFAQGFSFFSLSYFIRNKPVLGAVTLTFCGFSHLAIGLFTGLFIICYFIVRVKELFSFRVLISLAGSAVSCFLFFIVFSPENIVTTGNIRPEDFIRATQSFSYHWHPTALGLFQDKAQTHFLPLLNCLMLIGIGCTRWNAFNRISCFVLAGSVGTVLVATLGVIFSDFYPITQVIKLSLPRMTSFLSILGVLLGVSIACEAISKGKLIEYLAGVLALASLFSFTINDIFFVAWFPLALVKAIDFEKNKINQNQIIKIAAALSIGVLAIGFHILLFNPSLSMFFMPPQGFFSAAVSIMFLGFAWRIINHKSISNGIFASLLTLLVIIFSLQFFISTKIEQQEKYLAKYKFFANEFYAAQVWARENTKESSVFLTNPTSFAGWPNFSQRPTFGHYGDWGLSGFIYSSNEQAYKEGLRRFKLFGVDPIVEAGQFEKAGESLWGVNNQIQKKLRRYFNTMPLDELVAISRTEGIDYIVLEKGKHGGDRTGFTPIYETKKIFIFKVR